MSLDKYSQTPASNYVTPYWVVGMAPSSVKVAGSNVMADLCVIAGAGSMPTSGGSANAQTITNTNQYGALFTGMWAVFVPGFTNTGAMTLQVDGLTAKNVFANGAAALAGQVVSGIPAWCRYDGTQWQLANPQRSTGSFTLTLKENSGATTLTTGTVNYGIEPSGKKAGLWGSGITATSAHNDMTGTGVPSILVTGISKSYSVPMESSTAAIIGMIITGTSTTWTFGGPGTTGFGTSGTKGLGTTGTPFGWMQDLD